MPAPSPEIRRHYRQLSPAEETEVVEAVVEMVVAFHTTRHPLQVPGCVQRSGYGMRATKVVADGSAARL